MVWLHRDMFKGSSISKSRRVSRAWEGDPHIVYKHGLCANFS